jgi:hypothetical protein
MYCQIHTHLCIRHGVQTSISRRGMGGDDFFKLFSCLFFKRAFFGILVRMNFSRRQLILQNVGAVHLIFVH